MKTTKITLDPIKIRDIGIGRDMDKLITETFMRVKGDGTHRGTMVPPKVFRPCDVKHLESWNTDEDYYYITSGKPARTHMIESAPIPHFSTDWGAGGQLMERLKMGVRFSEAGGWVAESFSWVVPASAPTPLLAICRCALLAYPSGIEGGGLQAC